MAKYSRGLIALSSLILYAFLCSCQTVDFMVKKESPLVSPEIAERGPKSGPAKAVVLVLHGLNLKPERMDGWSKNLEEHGALVVSFALLGHGGDPAHMKGANADVWRLQFIEAVGRAQARAKELSVPLHFLGFSLGSLIALDYLANLEEGSRVFDKMVLIAPAIATPWYSKAAVGLVSIFGKGFILPSRSPKQYRANRGTSVAAYQALFAIKNSLEKNRYRNTNIDTLVLMDRHDELVISKGLRKIIETNRLLRWQLNIVDNQFAYDNYGFRHLLVDEESTGQKLWVELNNQVLKHFAL